MYTLSGDLTLQGSVVFGDFSVVVANFGKPAVWDTGAITYGSAVSFSDFALVVANYGKQAVTSRTPAAVATSAMTSSAKPTAPAGRHRRPRHSRIQPRTTDGPGAP
jgi:hypothetical protein